jgi:hypothetical protein
MTLVQLRVVMAGLDPAVHVLVTGTGDAGNRVDARAKPAHDDRASQLAGVNRG